MPGLLGLLFCSVYVLVGEWSVVRDMDRMIRIIDFATHSSSLIHELQKERG